MLMYVLRGALSQRVAASSARATSNRRSRDHVENGKPRKFAAALHVSRSDCDSLTCEETFGSETRGRPGPRLMSLFFIFLR